jgi:hypothetical protein
VSHHKEYTGHRVGFLLGKKHRADFHGLRLRLFKRNRILTVVSKKEEEEVERNSE